MANWHRIKASRVQRRIPFSFAALLALCATLLSNRASKPACVRASRHQTIGRLRPGDGLDSVRDRDIRVQTDVRKRNKPRPASVQHNHAPASPPSRPASSPGAPYGLQPARDQTPLMQPVQRGIDVFAEGAASTVSLVSKVVDGLWPTALASTGEASPVLELLGMNLDHWRGIADTNSAAVKDFLQKLEIFSESLTSFNREIDEEGEEPVPDHEDGADISATIQMRVERLAEFEVRLSGDLLLGVTEKTLHDPRVEKKTDELKRRLAVMEEKNTKLKRENTVRVHQARKRAEKEPEVARFTAEAERKRTAVEDFLQKLTSLSEELEFFEREEVDGDGEKPVSDHEDSGDILRWSLVVGFAFRSEIL
jgi:hypothetical protein